MEAALPTLVENDTLDALNGAQAALDLFANRGDRYRNDDWKEAVSTIVHLRTAAIGWREVEAAYIGFSLVPLDRAARKLMRGNAVKVKGLAKSADRIADGLCKRFRVPVESNTTAEYLTREFWRLFRDLYLKVQDFKFCWVIMVVGEAINEIERNRLAIKHNMPDDIRGDVALLAMGRDTARAFDLLIRAYWEMRAMYVDSRRERSNAA